MKRMVHVLSSALAVAVLAAGCTPARPSTAPSTTASRSPAPSASGGAPAAYASPRTTVDGRILFTIEARDATNKVAYVDASGLHVVPLPSASAPGNAVWDGPDAILFHGGTSDALHIYRASLDGTGVVQLTRGPSSQDSPAISPDRAHIAYGDYQGSQDLGVHEANADGSGDKTLTPPTQPGPAGNDEPSFSPDGRWIAYKHIVNTDRGLSELWVMRSDGTGARRLTSPSTDAGHPRFSPDSAEILFTEHADREGGVPKVPLWVIDRNGRNLRPLTDPSDPGTSWNGDWSPDGTQVVFLYFRSGWDHNELRVANRDGTNVRTLWASPSGASAEAPDWSG